MEDYKLKNYIKELLVQVPAEWLHLTTHRLDIYDEKLAKTEFLEQFKKLVEENNFDADALLKLPTAYDYIRLGHPLSCVLEFALATFNKLPSENVISFSSITIPVLAILRKNVLAQKNTKIFYKGQLPKLFNAEMLRSVYGYSFELKQIKSVAEVLEFDGSTIFISQDDDLTDLKHFENVDFYITLHSELGSVLFVNVEENESYISEIQHVRRRETIAMTPANCFVLLKAINGEIVYPNKNNLEVDRVLVLDTIKSITGTFSKPLVASSGLSMQYAIMMGLVHDAQLNHKGKAVKFIVPPNCYGGTNDQARRVAACNENIEVVDLPVDGDNDMVQSVDKILEKISKEDAVPYIIAEIPTNPRVEVPELLKLKAVLSKKRKTAEGEDAIAPVFILDQTFCPNVLFLGEGEILSSVRAISYASGSKFPSGGKCTAGYAVGNKLADTLMDRIEMHLTLCDNEATALQYEILAKQLPSMNQRIRDAYKNTREFVNFIQESLPNAKINFVSEELATQGFTPSVFSLDLPTRGNSAHEKEVYKRELNHKLIDLMITEIPNESKHCVSYGQLKGCYWTIPATSTQGTTKEGDKDYIARVSLSPDLNLELHKKTFLKFANQI